jgi:diketogulonate reductase-like aldo/keto reductase
MPILGARKISQLQDNLASLDLNLSADQVRSLDEASDIELGFPYYLYNKEMTRGLAYGGMRDRIIA